MQSTPFSRSVSNSRLRGRSGCAASISAVPPSSRFDWIVKNAKTLNTRSGLSGKNPSCPVAVTTNWTTIPHTTISPVTAAQIRPTIVMPKMYDE